MTVYFEHQLQACSFRRYLRSKKKKENALHADCFSPSVCFSVNDLAGNVHGLHYYHQIQLRNSSQKVVEQARLS